MKTSKSLVKHFYRQTKDYTVIIALLLLTIVFAIASPVFLRFNNLMNILLQTTTISIVAIGQATLLICGQLDLSLGQNVCLCGMVSAYLMYYMAVPPFLALFIGVLVGTLVGLCNGILFAKVGIPAFIATLGMQNVCRGCAKLITSTKTVAPLDDSIAVLGRGYIADQIPVSVIIMLTLFIIMAFIFSRTVFGRSLYAIGGNPESAYFAGINVTRHYIYAFTLAGAFAGLSSAILLSRLNSANIANGNNYEFEAMIGCVIGGISQKGGKGKIIGAMLGVMFSVALFNGMTILNVNSFLQDVFKGVVLLTAMAVDVLRNRKR